MDRELMQRVARRDEAACAEIIYRYGGRLLAVASRLLGSRAGLARRRDDPKSGCGLAAGCVILLLEGALSVGRAAGEGAVREAGRHEDQ